MDEFRVRVNALAHCVAQSISGNDYATSVCALLTLVHAMYREVAEEQGGTIPDDVVFFLEDIERQRELIRLAADRRMSRTSVRES